jgi:hypothetical protein
MKIIRVGNGYFKHWHHMTGEPVATANATEAYRFADCTVGAALVNLSLNTKGGVPLQVEDAPPMARRAR